jgi:hypothetical protein
MSFSRLLPRLVEVNERIGGFIVSIVRAMIASKCLTSRFSIP